MCVPTVTPRAAWDIGRPRLFTIPLAIYGGGTAKPRLELRSSGEDAGDEYCILQPPADKGIQVGYHPQQDKYWTTFRTRI